MQGTIGGIIALGLGVALGVVDALGADPPPIGTVFVLTFAVLYIATYYPLMIPGSTATPYQWAAWGLGAALALLGERRPELLEAYRWREAFLAANPSLA